ncbi:multicopper oxidase family protein [Micromonospora chokoriensis]
MKRRSVLIAGGAVVGGVLLGRQAVALADSPVQQPEGGGAGAEALSGTPFQTPMPMPPVAVPIRRGVFYDEYEINVQPAQLELVPGLMTDALTFGGGWVGPVIRGRTGRPVKVTFRNTLDVHTNVHLHGGHVAAVNDGHPMDMIMPGDARTYDYPNSQPGATLWYHDHVHNDESEHTYRGLHGIYIVDDPAEASLRLPTGAYDIPIMLSDVKIDSNGALIYEPPRAIERNVVLVNGKAAPFLPVAARKYRFRLINATNEGTYKLTLDKATMWQIGTDGGLLPAPVARPEITFGSGERVDVVVDFTGLPKGSSVVLSDAVKGPILRFDVNFTATDTSKLPQKLRNLPALPAATAERDVRFSFDFSNGIPPLALVNGKQFDADRVDFTIKRGTTEIWTVYNDDTEPSILHTFHLHMTHFRVLSRSGAPMTADDAGLKDTVLVPPGSSVRLQATFAKYLGRYPYHCHFLEHSSIGMMAQMEIVP